MKELFYLFWTFSKIGVLTFGGGYAMLPMLQKEVVEKNHWCSEDDLMDYFAIGQCTPGIIAVNTATFIGYRIKGIFGGIFATLGVVFPSIVIITIIAAFISNFASLTVVSHALNGIKICVCALILDAVIKLGKKSVIDKYCLIIFFGVFIISLLADISAIFLIIAAGIAGYVLGKVTGKEQN
ncbi:MAG: chromate transporter [Lachnospiraceae bacterium]|nr:chromate transporter [Lachnospiraceae bacterium]